MRRYLEGYMKPIADKVNNQWVRVSFDDISDSAKKESKCVSEAIEGLSKQPKKLKELTNVYREHDFLVIKSRQSRKDGSVGYEIDLNSQEAQDKFKSFNKAVRETEVVREINKCSDSGEKIISDDDRNLSSEKNDIKMVVWVNPWSHKLRGLDINYRDEDSKITYSLNQEFLIGKGSEVKVPSDYKTAKNLMEELQEVNNAPASSPYSGPSTYPSAPYSLGGGLKAIDL